MVEKDKRVKNKGLEIWESVIRGVGVVGFQVFKMFFGTNIRTENIQKRFILQPH